jgi:hypothetical protein
MADAQHDRYRDYVRLHTGANRIILIETEQNLLQVGIIEFGLTLDDVRSGLHGTAQETDTPVESQVERHIHAHLIEPRNRREQRRQARGVRVTRMSRERFDAAVDLFQTLTRARLSREEARKRVKMMVERLGLQARRDWKRLGSRKWYDGIKTD